MKFVSMVAGFVLASILVVGARAEPPAHSGFVGFSVNDLAVWSEK